MTDLATARAFFSSKINTDLPGIIAEQIVCNIDRASPDNPKTNEFDKTAALQALEGNLKRYAQARAETLVTTTE